MRIRVRASESGRYDTTYLDLYKSGNWLYITNEYHSTGLLYTHPIGYITRCTWSSIEGITYGGDTKIQIEKPSSTVYKSDFPSKNFNLYCKNEIINPFYRSVTPASSIVPLLLCNDDEDGVTLITTNNVPLLSITNEGTLRLYPNVPDNVGFQTDKTGRIITL